MRTIALFALAAVAFARKHIHGGESHHVAHHRHHHGEHHLAHHRAHHGEHGVHHIHHGEHAHRIPRRHRRHHPKKMVKPSGSILIPATKEHGNIVNRGAWGFFKKAATISGEDSHSHKKFKNPLSRRARRHMRKVHGGENGRPTRRTHGGEHRVRRNKRRNNKKVAKMNTKVVKVAEEKKATLALFKKVAAISGEDSHSHKKFKNPLSKRARRHMRKVHGGEHKNRRTHRGEHKQRRNKRRNNKKVAKMNTKVVKVADEKKPAALSLYELSQELLQF